MFGNLWEMLISASLRFRNLKKLASSRARGIIASVSVVK
jgi:hypothetical protein